MNRPIIYALLVLLSVVVVADLPGQEPKIQQLLCGQKTELTFASPADFPAKTSKYRFTYAERLLAIGQVEPSVEGDKTHFCLEVVLDAGLRSAVEVEVEFECDGQSFSRRLILFPVASFYDIKDVLARAKIQLLDTAGETAKVFEQHAIPFTRVDSIENVDSNTRLMVIGEGCERFGGEEFINQLAKLLQGGTNILCLAPSKSALQITAPRGSVTLENCRLGFESIDASNLLQSQFSWLPTNRDDRVMFLHSKNDLGWSIVEVSTMEPRSPSSRRSSILFCGFPVIEAHDRVPAARHILGQLIVKQISSISKPESQR